jgi:isoleucyl-tRNA synthetase
LLTTTKMVAPFVPFLAEAIWQNLAVAAFGAQVRESVHLSDFPLPDDRAIDLALSERMNLVREIVSLGRSARMGAKLKVRQPLAKVEVVLVDRQHQSWLEEHSALIAEELNVKQVEFAEKADQYISYTVLPDLKRLGPRLGKQLSELRTVLAAADAADLLARLESDKQVTLALPSGPVALDVQDLQVRLQAKPGWAAAQGAMSVVVLSTGLSESLLAEGLAHELRHAIQTVRKDMNLQYTDRIIVGVETDDAALLDAINTHSPYIARETLAAQVVLEPLPGAPATELKLGPIRAKLYVQVVPA